MRFRPALWLSRNQETRLGLMEAADPIGTGWIELAVEENSTLNTGAYEWAIGNGANTPENCGRVIPFDYDVMAMGLSVNNNNSVATVRAERNGVVFTNAAEVSTATERSAYVVFSSGSRPQGNAGDRFNFKTVSASSTSSPSSVNAWIRPR